MLNGPPESAKTISQNQSFSSVAFLFILRNCCVSEAYNASL